MENMKEQRMAISDEDLEKVAGGAGGTETYNYQTFANKLQALSEVITEKRVSVFIPLLKDTDSAVREKPKDFERAKKNLDYVRNYFGEKTKPYTCAGVALKYLADCGKITYP